MVIWLAVEVELNGTSQVWIAGKMTGKEGAGVGECCVLFLKERASL